MSKGDVMRHLLIRLDGRLTRLIHYWHAVKSYRRRLRYRLDEYDIQTMVDVCLVGVIMVWFFYLVIFKDVIGR